MLRVACVLVVVFLAGECWAQFPPPSIGPADTVFDPERKVRDYLKANVRDPATLNFLAFSKPCKVINCQFESSSKPGEWLLSTGATLLIYAKYKTVNTSGKPETITRAFELGISNGALISSKLPSQVRTGATVDPFSPQFPK